MTRSAWDAALEDYYAEHESLGTGADARGPSLHQVEPAQGVPVGAPDEATYRLWRVRQVLDDPAGHHDWVIEATVDLDASDAVGEPLVMVAAMRRL